MRPTDIIENHNYSKPISDKSTNNQQVMKEERTNAYNYKIQFWLNGT